MRSEMYFLVCVQVCALLAVSSHAFPGHDASTGTPPPEYTSLVYTSPIPPQCVNNPGGYYQPDQCTTCVCRYDGELPDCYPIICTPPPCIDYIFVDYSCCPVCPNGPGCQYGDTRYQFDSSFKPDPCTNCNCTAPGYVNCEPETCPDVQCENPQTVAGQCCAVCPE